MRKLLLRLAIVLNIALGASGFVLADPIIPLGIFDVCEGETCCFGCGWLPLDTCTSSADCRLN